MIDTATGAASLIGSFGASFVAGSMEYDPVYDRLLVINHANSGLYAADPSNAIFTPIGGTSDADTTDIWLDSASGKYYTAGNGPIHLGSLNTATGVVTPVASFAAYSGQNSLNGLATPLVPEPVVVTSLIVLPAAFLRRRRSR